MSFSIFILLYVILWDFFVIILLNAWIYYLIFFQKLIWFNEINLVVISSIFLLMKYVSLKKIVLVVGQINKK